MGGYERLSNLEFFGGEEGFFLDQQDNRPDC